MTNRNQRFRQIVWDYYHAYGRHDLPWRRTITPYKILVSEMMLQQTQVLRVLPKYQAFLKRWPTARSLSHASLGEVLVAWQGLGYNRRAKYLHQAVQVVQTEHSGRFPHTKAELERLPGIGPYTAGAVLAFAYNIPTVLIETNIRTVYLHHFFQAMQEVPDTVILERISDTLEEDHVREWYWALMDYGAYLKQTVGNQNQRSRQYVKQSKFTGSNRQLRGAVIRLLTTKSLNKQQIIQEFFTWDEAQVIQQLHVLIQEGLLEQRGRMYVLPGVSNETREIDSR